MVSLLFPLGFDHKGLICFLLRNPQSIEKPAFQLSTPPGHPTLGINSLDLPADGSFLVTSSLDGVVCKWDLKQKALLKQKEVTSCKHLFLHGHGFKIEYLSGHLFQVMPTWSL
jgi:WD40 repeat protein